MAETPRAPVGQPGAQSPFLGFEPSLQAAVSCGRDGPCTCCSGAGAHSKGPHSSGVATLCQLALPVRVTGAGKALLQECHLVTPGPGRLREDDRVKDWPPGRQQRPVEQSSQTGGGRSSTGGGSGINSSGASTASPTEQGSPPLGWGQDHVQQSSACQHGRGPAVPAAEARCTLGGVSAGEKPPAGDAEGPFRPSPTCPPTSGGRGWRGQGPQASCLWPPPAVRAWSR